MVKSTDQFSEHFIDPSKCLYFGTLALTVVMFMMSVIGIVGNIISVVILKKLMFSREIEHRLMTFILIAVALNDLLYEMVFPPLVFIYNVYPEYLQQKDWYIDFDKGDEPLFGRDSELLAEKIQLGRNVMKYSLQPGLMLNSLLLYLLLAFYLWYCARLKATIGNVRPEEMLRRRQTLFKLVTCGTPCFVTVLCVFMFYAAEFKGKSKVTLFAAASFLIAICVPIVILNYKRLMGVKQLIKELEGLKKGFDSSSSSDQDSDEDEVKDGPSQPPGHYLGAPAFKNQKSSDEHNRFSGDSYITNSSGSHNIIARDDDQTTSRGANSNLGVKSASTSSHRISIEGIKSRLDRLFQKKAAASFKKSKSEEEISRRHNNWKLTAIISSLCSVACVLPSMVYFIVKSTSFFSREYKADDSVSVCVGYISLSSLYMLIAPINFCINPFVYYLTNQEFREMLTETFRCKKPLDSDFHVSLDSFIQLNDSNPRPSKRRASSKKKASTRV